jgi:hypothetical protein
MLNADWNVNVWQIVVTIVGLIVTYGGLKILGFCFQLVQYFTGLRSAIASLLICVVGLGGVGAKRWHDNGQWNAQVRDYLIYACKTNDPQKAKKYVGNAVTFVKEQGMDDGFSSIVFKTPDEDLREWADNLKSVNEVFDDEDSLAQAMSQGKVPWRDRLMKTDIVKADVDPKKPFTLADVNWDVKHPSGISAAPFNSRYFWGAIGLAAGMILSAGWTTKAGVKEYRRRKRERNENALANLREAGQ